MCGIIGYVGERQAQPILLDALSRLEYRGYDSSGICIFLEKKRALSVRKLPGKLKDLENLLKKKPLAGTLAIGHVRWATHGAPNQVNAHPHLDCKNEIAIVHNGIIENYALLKKELIEQGHIFKSQTDTEVISHLIERHFRSGAVSLEAAVRKTLLQLEGSFALAVISAKEPNTLVGARRGSPLVVGLGSSEHFLASDVPALLDEAREVIFLEDDDMAVLTKEEVRIVTLSGQTRKPKPVKIAWDISQAQKHGWPHFMLKEINEQPKVLEGILNQRISEDKRGIVFDELVMKPQEFSAVASIKIVACGTAYHAGLCGKYILEELCKIPLRLYWRVSFVIATL